jgi:hypothetical protein
MSSIMDSGSSTSKRAWRRWTDDEERLLAHAVKKLGTKVWAGYTDSRDGKIKAYSGFTRTLQRSTPASRVMQTSVSYYITFCLQMFISVRMIACIVTHI